VHLEVKIEEVKIEGLEKFKAFLDTKVWYKAQKRTMTEMGRKFRARVVKDVRKVYNVKAKDLKKRIRTRIEKRSAGDVEWRMTVKGSPMSLTHFGARQTKKGVNVLIRKDEGRKILVETFAAKGQVFQRKGKGRLPIVAKKTLSAPQMFNEKTMKTAFEEVRNEYPKRFEHNLNFYLDKVVK